MSDAIRSRIAILQHRRRQGECQEALLRVSDDLGEPVHEPSEASVSLRLQTELYAKLKEMREQRQLHKGEFRDAESAVAAAHAKLALLGSDVLFEVYAHANGSGFFAGPLSVDFLRECLNRGYEGVSAVLPSLKSGVLLDVVLDDPLRGNFYEVEWW